MKSLLLAIAAVLVSTSVLAATEMRIEITASAVEKGHNIFVSNCNACHGLKYYRDKDHQEGYAPLMDPATAAASFGVAPPDLSLITAARGKGRDGARYVHELLTGYYTDADGTIKNRAFAAETQTEGVIAMPQPIAADDPALDEKARDVAAFLYTVSNPDEPERRSLGKYVIAYMAVMTALLFVLNKFTWKHVKKKLER